MEDFEKSTYVTYDAEKLLKTWQNQLEEEMPYPSDVTRMMVRELSAEVRRNKRNSKKAKKTIEIKPQPLPMQLPSASESSLLADCGTVIFVGVIVLLVISGVHYESTTQLKLSYIEDEFKGEIPLIIPPNSNDRPKS